MNRVYALILVVALLAPASVIQASEIGTRDEDDQDRRIREAVESQYVRGLQIRDFSLIRAICIEDAKLMGARDGKLRVTTLEKWSERFDPENPPFESLVAEVEKIDRAGTAAQVRIRFVVDSTREVTDFLNMVEIEGRWRVVNIIDH